MWSIGGRGSGWRYSGDEGGRENGISVAVTMERVAVERVAEGGGGWSGARCGGGE